MNMSREIARNPEPVPAASQLATLPFLAGVEGYLRGFKPNVDLRITLHRVMSREGREYLQQVCNYVGTEKTEVRSGSGRMFPVNYGIMGAAFKRGVVLRTRHFDDKESLLKALEHDMRVTGDKGDIKTRRSSWLAIPFLGPSDEPVMILFADTFEFNFFADDDRVQAIARMSWGFCRLIDSLEEEPFPNLRNFGFQGGNKVLESDTVYPTLQQALPEVPVPRFRHLRSFNYEASAA
jgi:hypothetical protein